MHYHSECCCADLILCLSAGRGVRQAHTRQLIRRRREKSEPERQLQSMGDGPHDATTGSSRPILRLERNCRAAPGADGSHGTATASFLGAAAAADEDDDDGRAAAAAAASPSNHQPFCQSIWRRFKCACSSTFQWIQWPNIDENKLFFSLFFFEIYIVIR